jgi:hypothetical protein
MDLMSAHLMKNYSHSPSIGVTSKSSIGRSKAEEQRIVPRFVEGRRAVFEIVLDAPM